MLSEKYLEKLYPGRRAELESITRYHAFDTMLYRTNDWIHSLRVAWLVEELLPVAKKHFKHLDADRAVCLALVHDDAETITGDIQAGHKATMSKKELLKVHMNERLAAALLGKRHPVKVSGKYPYGKLLLEICEKKTLEAQLVSYADKMDGYCESLHEVYAGNSSLLRSVIFYAIFFAQADKKLPKLKTMIDDRSSPFTYLQSYLQEFYVKGSKYIGFGKPFTMRSLKRPSQFSFYDRWRAITIKKGGKKGIEGLIKQKEFFRTKNKIKA
jgi:5'-deoxynucleotidase YfbR-like HD superfamily hydrolase